MAVGAMTTRTLDPKQVFLELLLEYRKASGISQEELAARIGWRQTDISKVQRGVRRIDVLELRTWLSGMEQSFAEFVTELDRRLVAQAALAARWSKRSS